MRIVVDGATGFIGKKLVNELLRIEIYVIAIVRNLENVPSEWKKCQYFKMICCKLEDYENINFKYKCLNSADIFIHFAWTGTSGDDRANYNMQLNNVKYTLDAISLAKRMKCKKFINAGSIMEYEAAKYIQIEHTRPGMGYIYSTAKLSANYMAKVLCSNLDISYSNLIISNIYGVGEKSQRFINVTLKKMQENIEIDLTHGQQLYDFIYIDDAVHGILLVVLSEKDSESYYIGSESQQPLKEYVLKMKSVVNSKSKLNWGVIPYDGITLQYTEFNKLKLRELGFSTQISFEEGIKKTNIWLLKEKQIVI